MFLLQFFLIIENVENLSPEERKHKRDELARPILNELHDWAFRLNAARNPCWARLLITPGNSGNGWLSIWKTADWKFPTTALNGRLNPL